MQRGEGWCLRVLQTLLAQLQVSCSPACPQHWERSGDLKAWLGAALGGQEGLRAPEGWKDTPES